MSRIICVILSVVLLASCSSSSKQAVKPTETYVTHKVQYSGETLGAISSWYTGTSANWTSIANANPSIQPKNIRIGDTIRIPERLVSRRDPLPKDFLIAKKGSTAAQEVEQVRDDAQVASTSDTEAQQTVVIAERAPENAGNDLNNSLYESVLFADAAKVTSLLQQGADPNYMETNRPMLSWAAQNGSVAIIESLLSAGAKKDVLDGVGHTALMRAVDMSQKDAAVALINAKVDLNAKTPDGKTALYLAVGNGSSEMTKLLLDAGANPDIVSEDGMYPALLAIQYGYPELIPLLASAKANFNLTPHIIYTPLLLAIEQGSMDLIRQLVEGGADPNVKSQSGQVPLLAAIDSPEIFDYLLAHKANPNVTNDLGQTALMVAVQNDSVERARELIKAGADVNVKDSGGSSALMFAQNMSRTELVDLLKNSGATE